MIEARDLGQIIEKRVAKVMVNPASVSLSFGDGGWLLVECGFILKMIGSVVMGSANIPESAAALLCCENQKVNDVRFDGIGLLTIFFENEQFLHLIPERDGLESYVLHTKYGIIPIINFPEDISRK
ncbi:hypothetical protein L7Q78_25705 [Achromobacter xylosoxidans]|nr:hypothetical protein [Achromobacter xylosoxidans]